MILKPAISVVGQMEAFFKSAPQSTQHLFSSHSLYD
jgi:hypothetical protein